MTALRGSAKGPKFRARGDVCSDVLLGALAGRRAG